MFIKDKAAHHSTARASSARQEAPALQCSRANAAGRDRCGEARPALGAEQRTRARAGAQNRGWRSLSHIEVAIALVLLALVSAVFRGVQAEPMLAFGPSETPYTVAPVSLTDYE